MRTVFLIYSPFQAICAFEAIAHYCINEYKMYCIKHINNVANSQVEAVLKRLNLKYQVFSEMSFAQSLAFAYKRKEHYDRLFIGDYFDPVLRMYASVWCKNNATVYYLDDGASTLTATRNNRPLSIVPIKERIKYILSNTLFRLKNISESFFSIFDLQNGKGEKNSLEAVKEYLMSKDKNCQSSVFIVGTKYTGFQNPEMYFDLLEHTVLKYELNNNTIYSPHRAVAVDPKVETICKNNGINYRVSDYCVELDYILNGANPSLIIGFGSTAMFSLKMIYPSARCVTVRFPDAMLTAGNADIYENVYASMKMNGIEVVKIM